MSAAEIVSIDAAQARNLTDKIKVAVEGTWQLITEAYTTRAWAALGYSSWDDYCTREFGTSRLRLPREDRQEIVSSMREQGLSIRAIAAATGEPVMTVQNELARVRTRTPEQSTPEPDTTPQNAPGPTVEPAPATEVEQVASVQSAPAEMHSYLLDPRGVRMVNIFYKAAFYDRRAGMHLMNPGYSAATEVLYGDDPVALPEQWPVFTEAERQDFADRISRMEANIAEHPSIYGKYAERAAAARALLPVSA